ncbi:hypothetical protein MIR68_008766 [Amoeboaphelidium protococcarum]|nr:hypothetical protein MIR68_008766 [Amoeboaphelidium protococcarum]
MADSLDCALDLMRRLPPQKVEENLAALIDIQPDLTEDLLSAVDQPLKVQLCKKTNREYLLCDYNRDGDSYRSPWSNQYEPSLPDGAVPSDSLRKMEVAANEAFDTYRDLYFEGGVSSVYMWDLDDGFAAVVLIKKSADGGKKVKGSWDSIHVVEVHETKKTNAHYKLTSTVMLYMLTNKPQTGDVNLSGSMTRQVESDLPLELVSSGPSGREKDNHASHIANIGRLIEDMEFKMRHSLQDIYFGKTKDIVNDLRSVVPLSEKSKVDNVQKELAAKLNEKSTK